MAPIGRSHMAAESLLHCTPQRSATRASRHRFTGTGIATEDLPLFSTRCTDVQYPRPSCTSRRCGCVRICPARGEGFRWIELALGYAAAAAAARRSSLPARGTSAPGTVDDAAHADVKRDTCRAGAHTGRAEAAAAAARSRRAQNVRKRERLHAVVRKRHAGWAGPSRCLLTDGILD
jgi:hypothetical protein